MALKKELDEAQNELSVVVTSSPGLPKIIYVLLAAEIIMQYSIANELKILRQPANFNYTYTKEELGAMTRNKMIIGGTFGFIAGALVDGYTGRFCLMYTVYIIGCFRPVLLLLLTVSHGVTESGRLLLFNFVGYFYLALKIVEPIRLALIFEQLKLPTQIDNVRRFASLFVIAHNIGTFIAAIIFDHLLVENKGPINLHCVLLLMLNVIYVMCFMVIKQNLKAEPIVPHVAERTVYCIFVGIYRSLKAIFKKKLVKRNHWLDCTENDFDHHFIYNAKVFVELLKFFFPMMTIFTSMHFLDTLVNGQTIKLAPSAWLSHLGVSAVVAMLNIISAFLFEFVFVVALRRFHDGMSSLKYMIVAYIIMIMALISSLVVHVLIEQKINKLPDSGYGQVRLYNAHENVVAFQSSLVGEADAWTYVAPHSMFVIAQAFTTGERSENVRIKYSTIVRQVDSTVKIVIVEKESISYVVTERGFIRVMNFDPILRGPPGMNEPEFPRAYILCGVPFCFGELVLKNKLSIHHVSLPGDSTKLKVFTVTPNAYNISIHQGEISQLLILNFTFKVGGVYSILIYPHQNVYGGAVFTVMNPSTLPKELILPHLILFSLGSTLLFIPFFCFVYIQSPPKLLGTTFACMFSFNGLAPALHFLDLQYWHTVISYHIVIAYLVAQSIMTMVFVYLIFQFKGQMWRTEGVVYDKYEPRVTTFPKQARRAFTRRSTAGSAQK